MYKKSFNCYWILFKFSKVYLESVLIIESRGNEGCKNAIFGNVLIIERELYKCIREYSKDIELSTYITYSSVACRKFLSFYLISMSLK